MNGALFAFFLFCILGIGKTVVDEEKIKERMRNKE